MKDSYVNISSTKLVKLANQSLKRTNKSFEDARRRRAEIIQEEIVDKQLKKSNSLWSFLFGSTYEPIPSIDEILESLSQKDDTEMIFIKLRYERYYDAVYRLLNAAEHADEVMVSTYDLSLLTSGSFE